MTKILRTSEFAKNSVNVKVGDKITITKMEGEPRYTGKSGVVTHIDDLGQLHGTWGGCAIIPNVDEFEVKEAVVSYSIVTKDVRFTNSKKEIDKSGVHPLLKFTFDVEFNISINGETTKVNTIWDFDTEYLYDADYDRATNTSYKNFSEQTQVARVNWDDLKENEVDAMKLAFGNENVKNIEAAFIKGFALNKEFNQMFDVWFEKSYGNPGMKATNDVVDSCARCVAKNVEFLVKYYFEN